MSIKLKPLALALAGALVAPNLWAVDLVGVHEQAAKNDPQLRAAAFRRDATGVNTTLARANFLPTLSASGNITRGDDTSDFSGGGRPDFSVDSDTDTDNLSLSLNQSIFSKANFDQMKQARAESSQADADYEVAYQSFLLRVAERYFAVLTAIDGLTFAEAEEKALQRQFEQAEQRFDVGLTAVTDVHEARASYDNARARVIVARNTLEDAQEGLRELTGKYFEELDHLNEELPLENPSPADPEAWVELAIENSPQLMSSQRAMEVAEASMKVQKAGHYPTLDLTASHTRFTDNKREVRDDFGNVVGNQTLENDDTRFTLQLNVPIYSGGSVSARSRQAAYRYEAAREDYEQQHRATVRSTENAYRAVIAGIQQVEAFQQARVSAESALEATQAGFEVGTRTIVDVLLAEQRYFQAQRDYSNARHTYILDHLRLRNAAGVLAENDLNSVNALLN